MAREADALNDAHGELATPSGVTHNLLQIHLATGDGFWRAVAVFASLFVLGIVGFVMRLSDGFSD